MRFGHKLGLFWAASLVGGVIVGSRLGSDPTTLAFLDVGQGDCAVFRHAGLTILIDVGPTGRNSDAPARQVVAELRRLGVRQVDLALLSHPDADHIGALKAIQGQIPIRSVAAMRHFKGHPDLESALKGAGVEERQVLWLAKGERLSIAGWQAKIGCGVYANGDPDNQGSMFVHLKSGTAAACFTGDADWIAEMDVLKSGDWAAQILKAGHHGSRSSTGAAWLAHVKPQVVVVSCGENNSYGHPAPETVERIGRQGAALVRTDREGTILFELANGAFRRVR